MKRKRSKLILSAVEQQVLGNKELYYTKRAVTSKLMVALEELKASIVESEVLSSLPFPAGTDVVTGKISKGENYLGLPYLILDFPRLFSPGELVAFRTMIWWGNFFSFTFLRSVRTEDEIKKVMTGLRAFRNREVWICISDSPWHHHFAADNYRKLEQCGAADIEAAVRFAGFLKVAKKYPLSRLGPMSELGLESFRLFSKLL
jgi:hypothetical protein